MDSTRRCSVDGCESKHYGRDWCKKHYNYFTRNLPASELGIPTCSVEDCEKPHYSKGYCRKHWERVHLHGRTGPGHVIQGASIAERIAHHSSPEGDCVVWTAYRDKDGYGQMQINENPVRVIRAVVELRDGPIPEGLVVRHKCDYPPCIKPEHLELGTHAENSRDKVVRGRSTKGSKNPAAKITASVADQIRERVAAGETQRSVAAAVGLSPSQVARIVRGESWVTF